MGVLSRMLAPFRAKATEGAYRDGPYTLPVSGGWLPAGTPWNFWQMGENVRSFTGSSAIVEACVSAYSQTAAMCPGDHWRRTSDGGRERVTNSALSRILRKPNSYQSASDFHLNLTRWLYCEGNAYALALRNDRNEIAELHLMSSSHCKAAVADGGEIFYQLGGNEVIDRRFGTLPYVPARDVLHVKLHTPRHVLRGETPLMAAAMDVAAGNVLLQRQIDFFTNRAQPSFILSTDQQMTAEQITELRAAWDRQTRGENAGGTPILAWGTKPHQVGSTAQDSQLAETMKMSEEHIALAFRVPLQVLGIGNNTYSSTESLMQSWIASGLGFALNHIEEAYGQLFGLRGMPDEYLELDTRALLRSAFKDRMEGLARAVQGGIYSPDEARTLEELPASPGGHGKEPRVQQQVVPLSWHDQQAKLQEQQPAPPEVPPADPVPDEEAARQFSRQVMAYARHVQ